MTIKISLLSLGCARNLVDSEVMLGTLKKSGFKLVGSPAGSDVAIVNTCSFIEDAKKESIEAILELIGLKEKKRLKSILVAGCLPQRYGKDLKEELKEVDAFIGVDGFEGLPALIKNLASGRKSDIILSEPKFLYDERSPRLSLTPKHYAYVKISEGCSHKCSFCIIPDIRGRHRSRTIGSIVREASGLIGKGAKEINIIGQDTTLYGMDLYGRASLAGLLKRLSRLKGARWIRLLYTHPAHFSDELISVISGEKAICKYIDLPVQHINDRILKRMNRGTCGASIRRLIDKLRERIPGIALRTAVIVGFPGETEREFRELLDFIKEVGFERLGAFTYSQEEGTRAADFKRQISAKEKTARWNEIMEVQQRISSEKNRGLIGRELEVLVDERDAADKKLFLGRSYMDAPEIDGTVYVKGRGIRTGNFVRARIVDGYEYDLVGEKI